MRICYLGDVNVQVRLVSEHFRALGHDVHICTFRPGSVEGVVVHPLLSGRLRAKAQYLTAVPRLRRTLARIRPDVVHAFYVSSYGFLGALVAADRLIVSAMGSDILIGAEQSIVLRRLCRWAVRHCRAVFSVAPHLTDRILRLGAPPEKVQTFPRGVDAARFHPGADPPRGRKRRIICVRRLEPLYNHRVLLEAAPAVLARYPEAEFLIVGDGRLRRDLERRCAELGVTAAFRFEGLVPHERLPELLRGAAVYFSGATSDGTSVSLLEAMGTGTYPVVADIPANRPWIHDGVNGDLFPPHDAAVLAARIVRALAQPERREAAAEANRRSVEERGSWAVGMARIEAAYRAVIESESGPRSGPAP